MVKIKYFLYFFLFFLSTDLWAQDCITPEMNQRKEALKNKRSFPVYEISHHEFHVIPVVFHIIYEDEAGVENIPDSRIYTELQALNENFGYYGPYLPEHPLANDTRFRFCLAKKDPEGNPTTGINRVKSPLTDLDTSEEMKTKNLSRWPSSRYLNIWIVRSIQYKKTPLNINGYSYLPDNNGRPWDGIVVRAVTVGRAPSGSTWIGRITTHEAGHYLGLFHIWGKKNGSCADDDDVADTPPCSGPFKENNCIPTVECGFTRMIENYMDYSKVQCRYLFTIGQGIRMRNQAERFRSGLMHYGNMVNTGCKDFFDSLNSFPLPEFTVTPNPASEKLFINYPSDSMVNFKGVILTMSGQQVKNFNLDIVRNRGEINISGLGNGMYLLYLTNGDAIFRQKFLILRNLPR